MWKENLEASEHFGSGQFNYLAPNPNANPRSPGEAAGGFGANMNTSTSSYIITVLIANHYHLSIIITPFINSASSRETYFSKPAPFRLAWSQINHLKLCLII